MRISDICIEICMIPEMEFDERIARRIIDAVSARISVSQFRHMDHGHNSREYLDDASTILGAAADDIYENKENEQL